MRGCEKAVARARAADVVDEMHVHVVVGSGLEVLYVAGIPGSSNVIDRLRLRIADAVQLVPVQTCSSRRSCSCRIGACCARQRTRMDTHDTHAVRTASLGCGVGYM